MTIGTTDYAHDRTKYERETKFDICPECGGRKQARSTLCVGCKNRLIAATQQKDDLDAMLDRHHRIEAALSQGWGLVELMALARDDALPTWEELEANTEQPPVPGTDSNGCASA